MKDILFVGNAIYARCSNCGDLVRINKFLFGSLHICLTDEEIQAKRRQSSTVSAQRVDSRQLSA